MNMGPIVPLVPKTLAGKFWLAVFNQRGTLIKIF